MALPNAAYCLHSLIPDPQVVLSLPPEELAWSLLEGLSTLPDDQTTNSSECSRGMSQQYAPLHDQVALAIAEAWAWLEKECLLVRHPRGGSDWYCLSRKARAIEDRAGFDKYRRANLLPHNAIHPTIADRVWASFVRSDYDEAVLLAFREVEIAVRDASGLGNTYYGVDLMKEAFHPDHRRLTDMTALAGEREALRFLFWGASGYFRNPFSHRNVHVSDPQEAVEMIMLATHLLRIIDVRRSAF